MSVDCLPAPSSAEYRALKSGGGLTSSLTLMPYLRVNWAATRSIQSMAWVFDQTTSPSFFAAATVSSHAFWSSAPNWAVDALSGWAPVAGDDDVPPPVGAAAAVQGGASA